MEVKVGKERANKNKIDQRLTIKKIDCNIMLVNTRSKVGWKKTTHPMDRTTKNTFHEHNLHVHVLPKVSPS